MDKLRIWGSNAYTKNLIKEKLSAHPAVKSFVILQRKTVDTIQAKWWRRLINSLKLARQNTDFEYVVEVDMALVDQKSVKECKFVDRWGRTNQPYKKKPITPESFVVYLICHGAFDEQRGSLIIESLH